jgi:hypothetical protein
MHREDSGAGKGSFHEAAGWAERAAGPHLRRARLGRHEAAARRLCDQHGAVARGRARRRARRRVCEHVHVREQRVEHATRAVHHSVRVLG